MTDTLPAPAPGGALPRLGQATAVEQSRAVAEVQAAIFAAYQLPRNEQTARAKMLDSCKVKALADRAFYRVPRGGQHATGASVHLARELARCWRNTHYGVNEMVRDDGYGQSELQAWAWDLESNIRVSATFIVPHKRDRKKGEDPQKLSQMADIYENNANNGARRVRECIFAVLPPWFVEEAKEAATKTLNDGGGVPLPVRIAETIDWWRGKWDITEDQLVAKLGGRSTSRWLDHDLGQLRVISGSLSRGEVMVDEEFPPPVIVAADLTAGRRPASPLPAARASEPGEPEPDDATDDGAEDYPHGVTPEALRERLVAQFSKLGQGVGAAQNAVVARIVGRKGATVGGLSEAEAHALIDALDLYVEMPDGREQIAAMTRKDDA